MARTSRSTAKCKIKSNKIGTLINRIDANIQNATNTLVKDGAFDFSQDIKNRQWWNNRNNRAINLRRPRTRANEFSIYWVLANGETNYEEAVGAFQGRISGQEHYGGRSVSDLTLDFHDPSEGEHPKGLYYASFASCSLILGFWEYGHNNKLTGRWERGATISFTALKYRRLYADYFRNLL